MTKRSTQVLRAGALFLLVTGCEGQISTPPHIDLEEPPPPPPALCTDDCGSGAAHGPITRLSRSEYLRSVEMIFDIDGFEGALDVLPPDQEIDSVVSNEAPIDEATLRSYAAAARAAAARVGAALEDCEADAGCRESLVEVALRRAYRRDPTASERTYYSELVEEASTTGEGLETLAKALLQSPYFLYHRASGEENEGILTLDASALASRISYFLWHSGPDDALLDAVAEGEFSTPDDIESHVRRMLADPRSDVMIGEFYLRWLGVQRLNDHNFGSIRYPEAESLFDDMLEETRAFGIRSFRAGGDLASFFVSETSPMSPALAAFYGLDAPDAQGESRLDGERRVGALTQASFLIAHSSEPFTHPVHRGLSVLRDILCVDFPSAPAVVPGEFDPGIPIRQKLEDITADSSCQTCHRSVNGIGFAFSNYDGGGGFQTQDEHGFDIDPTGQIYRSDVDGTVAGVRELSERLAESQQVRRCMIDRWVRSAIGGGTETAPVSDAVFEAYSESNDLREAIVAITLSEGFRQRRLTP